MKTTSRWDYRSIVGKTMMGLVLAAMIGSIEVTPALAKDDHKRMEKFDKHDKGRKEYKGHGHDRGRRVYRSYGYSEPVYVPPPVYYEPPPPPGLHIFLPF